jgi:hypothetical protein
MTARTEEEIAVNEQARITMLLRRRRPDALSAADIAAELRMDRARVDLALGVMTEPGAPSVVMPVYRFHIGEHV